MKRQGSPMKSLARMVSALLICALLTSGHVTGQGSQALGVWGFDQGARMVIVPADFTTASASLVNITGLQWTLPANAALSLPFVCELAYSQATAAVANSFGIQAVNVAPTNIFAKGEVWTNTTVVTEANLPTLATTTATAIVTATPSAITTVWNARLSGLIENPSNATPNQINIMVLTGNASDSITVKRGSWCKIS